MNAKTLQDRLNGHGLLFRITDERIKQTTYEKSNDIVGVLEMMAGGYLYDQTGNRVYSLQVEFTGANTHFGAFREIIDTYFPNDEEMGGVWVYSQPLEFTDFAENEGNKKFKARVLFQIVEVVGGVSGKSSYVKIDGVEIDFARVLYRQDKSLLPTKAFGNNKDVRIVSELLTLKLPVSDNVKNQELLLAALNDSYNVSYLVEWQVGGIIKTFDAVLRVGLMEYDNTHKPILFDITFERALARELWEVALWHNENFWDIDKVAKPFDESYETEYATESDFRAFLDTLDKLDAVGYTVRSGSAEQVWEELYGSPSDRNDLYEYESAEELDGDEDFIEFLKMQYGDLTEADISFVVRISYLKVKPHWVFIAEEASTVEGTELDEVNLAWVESSFMAYLNANYPPQYYNKGIYYIGNDYTQSNWVAELVYEYEYRYYELTGFGGSAFYGEVVGGGNYDSGMNAPVIDYSMKQSVDTTTRKINRKVVGDYKYYGTGFVVLFLINDITQQMIDNLYEQLESYYKITFKINGKEYEYSDLIITDIERQNTENANQVMQVTFAEGSIE